MQKRGKIFSTGHRSSSSIKLSFGIGHPPPIYQMQCICGGEGSRVPNLQTEFNYLNSFKSYGIFSDFIVPMWSLSSPCRPCHPHIIPTSSPLSPHHSHSPQKVPMWSPRLWSPPMLCPLSPSSPCHPCHPHIISVIPTSSPHHLEGPQIISNPPDMHPTHPHPLGVGGPESLKMQ